MKVKITVPITDMDGTAIKSGDKDLTLRETFCNSLMNAPDSQTIDGAEKCKRYDLAVRIHRHSKGEIDLNLEEVTLLKDLVGKTYFPIVVGQVWSILDPAPDEQT